MSIHNQLAVPSQLVPNLQENMNFGFRNDEREDATPLGLSFKNVTSVGQNFASSAIIQPAGVAVNAVGDRIRFNQNKPWEKTGGSGNGHGSNPAQRFAPEDFDGNKDTK